MYRLSLLFLIFIFFTGCDNSQNCKKILVSDDYHSLSKKLSFDVNVLSCFWEELEKREGKESFFIPSRYNKILVGFIVVSSDDVSRIKSHFSWQPAPFDEFSKKLLNRFSMDKQLIYSAPFQKQITKNSPYNTGIILFDLENEKIYFYLMTI